MRQEVAMLGPFFRRSDRTRAALYLGALVCAVSLGCADGGKKIADPGPNDPPPAGSVVERLVPGRTVVADTVRIEGTGFGPDSSSAVVTFEGGSGRIQAEEVAWGEANIIVLVPDGAISGPVSVRVADVEGEGRDFSVASNVISYEVDLLPLLHSKGCVDCHSGPAAERNLQLDTAANLLSGGSLHGPVVIPRHGPESILTRKVSANPPVWPDGGPSDRMPVGCITGRLTDEQILSISTGSTRAGQLIPGLPGTNSTGARTRFAQLLELLANPAPPGRGHEIENRVQPWRASSAARASRRRVIRSFGAFAGNRSAIGLRVRITDLTLGYPSGSGCRQGWIFTALERPSPRRVLEPHQPSASRRNPAPGRRIDVRHQP
jgi:hypothetical protein